MPILRIRNPKFRLAAYALAGLYGAACLIVGGSWLIAGKGMFVSGFPSSLAEAAACAGGGAVVGLWAWVRIWGELRNMPTI